MIPYFDDFDLTLPQRIVFGWGKRADLGKLAAGLGKRALVVDGSRTLGNSPVWEQMLGSLREAGLHVEHIASATREPTVEVVDQVAQRVQQLQPRAGDLVIGIGGGSALDLAKATAAMATNGHGRSVRDFLEGVGTGQKLEHAPLPILAVPTTAGTGAEATRNAVISVTDPPCKKSLRADGLMPRIALVDPELTVSCPPQQTAWSGMDALTQIIESFVSNKSQIVVAAQAAHFLMGFCDALRTAVRSRNDTPSRNHLSRAALLSGIALANCGLGMAHGIAAALGSLCDVPHGLACAVLLPTSLRVNGHHEETRDRYSLLASYFSPGGSRIGDYYDDSTNKNYDLVCRTIADLCRDLHIPTRLRDIGVKFDQIPALVAGSRGNSMSCNPRQLTDQELTAILEENW